MDFDSHGGSREKGSRDLPGHKLPRGGYRNRKQSYHAVYALPTGRQNGIYRAEGGRARRQPYRAVSVQEFAFPDRIRPKRRVERWRKIAAEAAKQCGRGRLPEVAAVVPVAQAISAGGGKRNGTVFYGNEKRTGLHDALCRRCPGTTSFADGRAGGRLRSGWKQRQPWTQDCRSVSLGTRIRGVRLRRLRRLRLCSMPAAT